MVSAIKSSVEVIDKEKVLSDLITTANEKIQELDSVKQDFEEYAGEQKKYADEQNKKIEERLSLSTTAGLASAFGKLQSEMYKGKRNYQWLSYGLLVVILVMLISSYDKSYSPMFIQNIFVQDDNDPFFMPLLKRIGIISPLLWIAIDMAFKSRQYFRLEQEYAHKNAVSMSFEGYKAQAKEIDELNNNQEMLSQLLKTAIETIGKNPSKSLDKMKGSKATLELMNEQFNATLEQLSKIKELISTEQSSKEKNNEKNK